MKVEIPSHRPERATEYIMIGSMRFALLPLTVSMGCNDLLGTEGSDCEGSDCTQDSGDGNDPETYVTSAHMVAPYGWMGDFEAAPVDDRGEVICENAAECLFEPDDPDTYELELEGDLFLCVSQETTLSEANSAKTTEFTWEGEGQCGLAPEGEADGGWEVSTHVFDRTGSDLIWIQIDGLLAIVTEDTFFYEDSDYLLEGWISADLSQVYFHRVVSTGETEMTLTLQ